MIVTLYEASKISALNVNIFPDSTTVEAYLSNLKNRELDININKRNRIVFSASIILETLDVLFKYNYAKVYDDVKNTTEYYYITDAQYQGTDVWSVQFEMDTIHTFGGLNNVLSLFDMSKVAYTRKSTLTIDDYKQVSFDFPNPGISPVAQRSYITEVTMTIVFFDWSGLDKMTVVDFTAPHILNYTFKGYNGMPAGESLAMLFFLSDTKTGQPITEVTANGNKYTGLASLTNFFNDPDINTADIKNILVSPISLVDYNENKEVVFDLNWNTLIGTATTPDSNNKYILSSKTSVQDIGFGKNIASMKDDSFAEATVKISIFQDFIEVPYASMFYRHLFCKNPDSDDVLPQLALCVTPTGIAVTLYKDYIQTEGDSVGAVVLGTMFCKNTIGYSVDAYDQFIKDNKNAYEQSVSMQLASLDQQNKWAKVDNAFNIAGSIVSGTVGVAAGMASVGAGNAMGGFSAAQSGVNGALGVINGIKDRIKMQDNYEFQKGQLLKNWDLSIDNLSRRSPTNSPIAVPVASYVMRNYNAASISINSIPNSESLRDTYYSLFGFACMPEVFDSLPNKEGYYKIESGRLQYAIIIPAVDSLLLDIIHRLEFGFRLLLS